MSMQQAKTDVHLAKCSYPHCLHSAVERAAASRYPGTCAWHPQLCFTSYVHQKAEPTASPCTFFLPGGGGKKPLLFGNSTGCSLINSAFGSVALLPVLTSFPLGCLGFLQERWEKRQRRPVPVPAVQTVPSCSPPTQTHAEPCCQGHSWLLRCCLAGLDPPFNFCGGEKSSLISKPSWKVYMTAIWKLIWRKTAVLKWAVLLFLGFKHSNVNWKEKSPCNLMQNNSFQ